MRYDFYDRVTSTQDIARQNLLKGYGEGWVVAAHQTHGKGRQERVWHNGDKNFMGSHYFPLKMKAKNLGFLSWLVGLAVYVSLDDAPSDVKIKWPNDLYFQDQKFCGILIETFLSDQDEHHIIAGIGINLYQAPQFSDRPSCCLNDFLKNTPTVEQLLEKINKNLIVRRDELKHCGFEKIAKEWDKIGYGIEKDYFFEPTQTVFRLDGIGENGCLILSDPNDHKIHVLDAKIDYISQQIVTYTEINSASFP